MFGYEKIGLSLAYPVVFLVLALLLIAGYSFYVYRYTIPQVARSRKIFLISLRVLALLSLCFILFEPTLNLSRNFTTEPHNLIFIDNSKSIIIEDGTDRILKVKNILDELSSYQSDDRLTFYEFGNSVREIDSDSLDIVNFKDGSTNLQDIISFIKNSEENIASATIISDGVITSGNNPYYEAIKLGIPIFAIGIGDTSLRKDVEIKKVIYNDFLYANTPTTILASIFNKGFSGESVNVSLYEDNKFVSQETINLSNTGFQNVSFPYEAKTSGEKKLSVQLTSLKDEFTTANNKKIFYVNVLSNKIKIVLLSSSPSADLTFIQNSLRKDENLNISTVVQIAPNKFLDQLDYRVIDSADVFFLIGFPSDQTPDVLQDHIFNRIKDDKIPYFLTLSSDISFNRLQKLGNDISFNMTQISSGFKEVQPQILPEQINNPIFKQGEKNLSEYWNNLPPVLQTNSAISSKVESKILAQIKVNNISFNAPLILSKNFSGRRSITVLAYNIWKWKLQLAPKGIDLFDSFIVNSVRWLRAGEEQKLLNIKSSKKIYSQGERVEFSAQLVDESLNPVSESEIKIKIRSDKNEYDMDMQNVGPGLYEGSIIINEPGDYRYSGEAYSDGIILGKDNGSFNIGEIDIEMVNPVMNYSLLNLLAKDSGGEFYPPDDFNPLITRLNELTRTSSREKIVKSEITLWSDTWMLLIATFLFSLEWFIRKRSGML